eukprot:scaffold13507_cov127-Isochrysis_galbana.AAC.3
MERTVCGLNEAEAAVGGPARDLAPVPRLVSPRRHRGRVHGTPLHSTGTRRPRQVLWGTRHLVGLVELPICSQNDGGGRVRPHYNTIYGKFATAVASASLPL